jgi:hypothetical protein
VWQNCGFYTVTLTNEFAVHSLEHGAVWITYTQSVDQVVKTALAAKAKASPYVLVSLYPDNPTPIVVTAVGPAVASRHVRQRTGRQVHRCVRHRRADDS